MKRREPSAAIGQWSPKTGWSPAGWKPNGRTVCAISRPQKWSCGDGSNNDPARSAPSNSRRFETLGSDIHQVWNATTTTDRDRKELLRTLLEEVVLNLKRAEGRAHLTLRWRGGAITMLDVPVPRFKPMGPRTDEDTISLLRRLAALYPDEVIAGILNRQGRKTATGERFTANQVGSLRRYRDIPRFQPPTTPPGLENWFPSARRRRFWE